MAHDEQDSKREGPEAAQPVDLVVHNGRITTLDADDRCVQAAAVRGGRIVALGEDQTVLALAGPHTRLVDAAGRRVVPGLIDGHAHMDREGLKEALPSLAGCRSIDDVLQRI
ncbi:MAG: amidohydrolase family protein, partial [Gammaproteobacteria bacterium]|nr:amidohydrolase family protein [Gammaproteobacteria bacterium]